MMIEKKWSQYNDGVYQVGNEVFYSKVQALEYSSRTGEQVHYHFFDDVWDSLDWETEPVNSLDELYIQRAQQLRDKYDYLVLTLSGGSDSTNMVKTFLKAGIRPDEVISYGVINKIIGKNSTTNIEITQAASKTVKLLEEASIPWRFLNAWDYIKHINLTDEFYRNVDNRLSPDNLILGPAFANDPNLQTQAERGKKVGVIVGKEKPRLHVVDGYFVGTFLDMNLQSSAYAESRINYVFDKFYSTPSMPEITLKQMHVLIRHFRNNVPNFDKFLTHTGGFDASKYYNIIQDIIYPEWQNKDYFTLGKASSTMLEPKYKFVWDKMPDWDVTKQYKHLLRNLRSSLNEKYIQKDANLPFNQAFKLPGFYNKFYKICKV